jgi:peptidoglycan/xylan/chitin deacetylase (PgdA/CDA1 family)
MKAIMYHYVRAESPELPYFKQLHVDDFRKQLDWFQENDRLLSLEEFEAIMQGAEVPEDGVVLTFDDGFMEHYDAVMPELLSRGTFGIFYLSTAVYCRPKLLDVHRIHYLLGRFGGVQTLERLLPLLKDEVLSHSHVDAFRKLTYARQDNDAATTQVKRVLNYFVSYAYRERILDELMAGVDEASLANAFYVRPEHIAEMQARGMMIGSHSVSHRVFSKLEPKEQKEEIAASFRCLERLAGGLKHRTFCYPYGGFYSFTEETERLLREANCRFAFNVEPRDIGKEDILKRPMALPRYDCNQFPYGKVRAS